jgi:hypothetical protein
MLVYMYVIIGYSEQSHHVRNGLERVRKKERKEEREEKTETMTETRTRMQRDRLRIYGMSISI